MSEQPTSGGHTAAGKEERTAASSRRQGVVLVLCAPSGTGKSTLVQRLVRDFPSFSFSISCTTREPRGQERDGVDYYFLTKEQFLERRERGEFAEWAEVHGNYYGTPLAPVREIVDRGGDVLFDIDVQGAMQLRESFPDGRYVFLFPPSRDELQKRLRGRGTDSEEAMARRLANAVREMEAAPQFDHWIVNRDLDRAYDELRAVYLAGCSRPGQQPGLLREVLDTFAGEDA
ncbi:guanylate kinase [Paucidesulfovibrio gracilis DSM 16080]|uniref:Guanylate kinase n=1 Tax=Paucidesulfovibrio gracilis DSM 16080 TaxID=1121449 RepID=A0A1T4WBV9_9BACT|nr:guanylate kinase [Paucidesulfovibrio gracilis]SKA74538.1 guanylate kinase [Paucidesulfovibrio gracilis DSM 16080]